MALQQKHYFPTIMVFFASLFFPSYNALEFDVGGSDGWVLNPSESYNHWAGRMRFQVNDTLLFWYKKGRDSVLEVGKEDYEKCNTRNPIKKMDDGYSVFELDRSGPFYFISGIQEKCENGQKVAVVVLAVRNHNAPPPPPPPPPPPRVSPATPSSGGCSSSASPPGQAPSASPSNGSSVASPSGHRPDHAPTTAVPPSFHAPAAVSPAKSPLAGEGGCNDSSIRSDPANVHNSPAGSPPKSTSAAPAAIHLSAILVSTSIYTICFAFGEFLISS